MEDMKQSTVYVICRQGNSGGGGSGFVVGKGRHVVTNWHVAACSAEGGQVGIVLARGQGIPARVAWKSVQHDLAILELTQDSGRPPVSFALSKHVKDDEEVRAMGFPGAACGEDVDNDSGLTVKVTKGVISA